MRARAIVGAPEQVVAKLAAAAAAHGAQEVAVLTPCHDQAARQTSFRLLAEANAALPAAA
jgi:alkanesulfonate monooxygenase SsuD/methylene tetrahydromethanopterin reductase-like flavin-dependent oxidoreductase (luciferase family)